MAEKPLAETFWYAASDVVLHLDGSWGEIPGHIPRRGLLGTWPTFRCDRVKTRDKDKDRDNPER
jgi:hypothetical protein